MRFSVLLIPLNPRHCVSKQIQSCKSPFVWDHFLPFEENVNLKLTLFNNKQGTLSETDVSEITHDLMLWTYDESSAHDFSELFKCFYVVNHLSIKTKSLEGPYIAVVRVCKLLNWSVYKRRYSGLTLFPHRPSTPMCLWTDPTCEYTFCTNPFTLFREKIVT